MYAGAIPLWYHSLKNIIYFVKINLVFIEDFLITMLLLLWSLIDHRKYWIENYP